MHHDIELTKRGERYALSVAGIPTDAWRNAIESRIERHLAIATGLLALIDNLDGDPDAEVDVDLEEGGDLEPSVAGDDREADPTELQVA